MREKEREVDVIMFIMTLSMSAYRFAKNERPFDFENSAVAELMTAKALPFIKQENVDYEKAHQEFLQTMFENGWKEGHEDFVNRTHPDLCNWNDLSQNIRDAYAYTAALISSAKEFYKELRGDLENEILDQFNDYRIFYHGNSSPLKRDM